MSNKNIPKQDDEWGNIDLPGIDDEKLYGYNWNYSKTKEDKERQKIAMQNRDNSSHKEAGRKRANDPVWREAQAKASRLKNKEMTQTQEWKDANAKKYKSEEYWNNYYEGIKKRDADEKYTTERLIKSKKKIRKPVQTPLGVFETQTEASKAHGFANTEKMRHRCKSDSFPDYKMISIEEYERLKNEC